ncbi:MAG TPA: hypothetical protein VLI67_08355, partial [Vicinamibacteria bacterium]|nr:hypothetical protein [Vicinamibacteria bacterium]
YCNDVSPAAMACCEEKAAGCNQPGSTDDCCRKVPVEKDAATAPGQQLAPKPHATSMTGLDAVAPFAPTMAAPPPGLAPAPPQRTAWADLAPPPLSVLRL